MKRLIFSILVLWQTNILLSQNDSLYRMSLTDAIEFAYENNVNVTNAELEIRKAKWKVWETTAIGLPQVNGSAEFQDFPDIPTQLMPNFLMPVIVGVNTQYFGLMPVQPLPDDSGKIPVQFGSKYNLDYGISISQLIFSGEYIVGLQAARTFKLISEQNYEKAKIELKSNVEQAYFLALIAGQSREILEQSYENIKKLASDNEKMAEQGIINQTQADQIKILELNLKNQISSIKRQEQLAYLMLKFQMGMTPQDSLVLTDSLEFIKQNLDLKVLAGGFDTQNNINMQLMNTQVKLKYLDLRRAESKTLPQIAAFYSYSNKAMRDTFDFFDTSNDEWFKTTVWGLKLSVPIFSSGQRASVIQQKKIEVMEAENQRNMLSQSLNLQFEQAKSDYLNALDNLYNQEQNMKLSEKIYKNTQISFREGTASSMDLTQAQNQYLQAEASYYQALMNALKAKTSLEKLMYQTENKK